MHDYGLFFKVQLFDDFLIGRRLLLFEIAQKLTAAGNHFQESAARMIILRILLQMGRKLVDLPRNNSDLNLRGTRIGFVLLEFPRNAGLYPFGKHGFMIHDIGKKGNSFGFWFME
jgi:hypothetical protein